MSLVVMSYCLKSLKISYRFRTVAPPPFWLFLPQPQKRKKYILKISKKNLVRLIVISYSRGGGAGGGGGCGSGEAGRGGGGTHYFFKILL